MRVADYRWIKLGEWRLVVEPGSWNEALQKQIIELVEQQPWAKHPQTVFLQVSSNGHKVELFLKIMHANRGGASWKNWLRRSKALQAWRQGAALVEAGFHAPMTVAAGEQRRFGGLRRSFILSRKVTAQGAPFVLSNLLGCSSRSQALEVKRCGLWQLAATIRDFHDKGFVHGDMLATNIFIRRTADDRMMFYFMDNDRTRRYPRWLPQSQWKRNLVQLNRLPLPGITLQDRMRFFHAYLRKSQLSSEDAKLARWFERKTRERRQECDGASSVDGFRRLMRWFGDPTNCK